MKIDPAKLAVIRDVLNEMGVDIQTDEEVALGLEILAAAVTERRLRDDRWQRLYYGKWPD